MKLICLWRQDMYRKVIKQFRQELWNITNDIIDRALDYKSDNPEHGTFDAVVDAIDDALIYTQDQWLVFEQYVFTPAEASEVSWAEVLGAYAMEIHDIISTFIGD